MKTIVETLLRQTGRANIDKLLTMMEQHGYYSVPSDRHHQGSGGTLHHSLEVLLYALKHNKYNPLAELNQRIFDSSNGFIVNKVNIL